MIIGVNTKALKCGSDIVRRYLLLIFLRTAASCFAGPADASIP